MYSHMVDVDRPPESHNKLGFRQQENPHRILIFLDRENPATLAGQFSLFGFIPQLSTGLTGWRIIKMPLCGLYKFFSASSFAFAPELESISCTLKKYRENAAFFISLILFSRVHSMG